MVRGRERERERGRERDFIQLSFVIMCGFWQEKISYSNIFKG